MTAKYFNFVDGQRLPGNRVKEFLMNQAVIQCENQTEITSSGIEVFGARVALNMEDGQIWTYGGEPAAWAPAQNALDLDLLDARYLTRLAADGLYLTEIQADGKYLTDGQAAQKYLTILTAQGLYITEGQADGKYLTPAQANALYLTPLDADSRYVTIVSAGQIYLRKDDADTSYQKKPTTGTFITDIQAGQIYLSQTTASQTYLTQINAGTLYLQKGNAASDINSNSTTIDGGKITTNSINVNRLVAGTLTGFRVQTSSSGQRVVMSESSNSLSFWNSSGNEVGRMTGLTAMNYDSTSNHAFQVNGSTVFSVTSSGVSLSPSKEFNSNLPVNGTITASSTISANGGLAGGGTTIGSSVQAAGAVVANADGQKVTLSSSGALIMDLRTGTGTRQAGFDANGSLVIFTSSERYKQDIENLVIDKNDVLNLQPKSYRRIEEVNELGDDAVVYAGFIAEDLAGTSLDKFVFYTRDENDNLIPDGIHYGELTAALVTVIKDQEERLNSIEARLAALEGGAQ